MIKITAEFDKNKVESEFEEFEEVYDWFATIQLLYKKKKEKQCIGFTGNQECEDEPTDEKEKE
jgi:hypothetical protein